MPPLLGVPSARSTLPGSATARCKSSLVARPGSASRRAWRQSARSCSALNIRSVRSEPGARGGGLRGRLAFARHGDEAGEMLLRFCLVAGLRGGEAGAVVAAEALGL